MESAVSTSVPTRDTENIPTAQKSSVDKNQGSKHSIEISDKDVEKLKQHIRTLKNLTPRKEIRKKTRHFANEPDITPKSNTAASLRTKLQDRWIELNLKSLMKKYSYKEEDLDSKLYNDLRREALTRPLNEYCEEKQRESFENLKKFSQFVKNHDEPDFRHNRNFDFRVKNNKGIPIITETFTNHYEEFEKAPFINPNKCTAPKYCHKPPINEEEEIFLYPVDEEDEIPLHRIKKIQPKDQRSWRERARPPLKFPFKRTPIEERGSIKPLPTKKPPWHYAYSCKQFDLGNN